MTQKACQKCNYVGFRFQCVICKGFFCTNCIKMYMSHHLRFGYVCDDDLKIVEKKLFHLTTNLDSHIDKQIEEIKQECIDLIKVDKL